MEYRSETVVPLWPIASPQIDLERVGCFTATRGGKVIVTRPTGLTVWVSVSGVLGGVSIEWK